LSEAIRISEAISKSPDNFRNYYVPVFKQHCDGTPYHAGTAFGFEHNGRRRLLTALHVFDKDQNNPCDSQEELYLVVAGVLRGIGKFNRSTLLEKGMPKKTLDIAIVEPLDFDVTQVFQHFFTTRDLYRARLHQHLYVAACGFPASSNRASWRNAPLKNRPYGYFGRASAAWKVRLAGFSSRSHFGIDIFLAKAFTRTQREVKTPKPHGISGGPVLIVCDLRSRKWRPHSMLRGLVIESAQAQRCLICIDLLDILWTAFESNAG
jgi:hypothetical protein